MKITVLGGGGVRSPFLAKSILSGAHKIGITHVVEKVAIEYEYTIKSKKRYQEIIGQYMDIKDRGIIKHVIYFTNEGFADKLKQLFTIIEFIYRNNITERINIDNLTYFHFL